MGPQQIYWAKAKQLLVIALLVSGLVIYRTLDSSAAMRNQFLTELAGWNLASLIAVIWTARLVERRQFCNWFRCSFIKIAISRIGIYLSFSFALALMGMVYYKSFLPGLNNGAMFWSSFLFYAFVYFIATVTIEVSKLVGNGFVDKLILGNYHLPKKEKRIFLFIDLRESTKLSKELSLDKYSFLIKEFFRDIDIVMERFKGEIYQYAGDQVIVTWPASPANYNNAVLSFIEFYERMKAKRSDYIRQYGVAPLFKAGMHSGKVIGTWVGRMKRELVFQGDILNITARLTDLAKNLSFPIVLTQQIAEKLTGVNRRRVLEAGSYSLKGIKIPMEIYLLRLEENNDHIQKTMQPMRIVSRNEPIMSHDSFIPDYNLNKS